MLPFYRCVCVCVWEGEGEGDGRKGQRGVGVASDQLQTSRKYFKCSKTLRRDP